MRPPSMPLTPAVGVGCAGAAADARGAGVDDEGGVMRSRSFSTTPWPSAPESADERARAAPDARGSGLGPRGCLVAELRGSAATCSPTLLCRHLLVARAAPWSCTAAALPTSGSGSGCPPKALESYPRGQDECPYLPDRAGMARLNGRLDPGILMHRDSGLEPSRTSRLWSRPFAGILPTPRTLSECPPARWASMVRDHRGGGVA